MKTLTCLCIPPVIAAMAGAAPSEDIEGAQVTLPYKELKALLSAVEELRDRVENEDPRPPVDVLLRSSDYQIEFRGDVARIRVEARAENLTREWQFVPLIGAASARMESVDPVDAKIVHRDGTVGLLVEGGTLTEAVLVLRLDAPAAMEGISFAPASATLGRLSVRGANAGEIVRVKGATSAGEPGMYLLGGAGEVVRVWREAQVSIDDGPAVWDLDAAIHARHVNGRMLFEARLHLHAEKGKGERVRLSLPREARVLSAAGEELVTWSQRLGSGNAREVEILWKSPEVLDREAVLLWEVAQPSLAEEWKLVPPAVADGGDMRALFVVEAVEGMEIRDAAGELPAQPQQLPEWLREKLGGREYATFRADADAVTLKPAWLPVEAVADATVEKATVGQRLVADGSLLTTAEYEIQHRAPVKWRLRFAEIGRLLACRVGDGAVHPVRRGENELEFSLPGSGKTKVEICYAEKLQKLDPVSGSLELVLPFTDLFMHQLDWTLEMPSRYETTAAEGNVEVVTSESEDASDATLKFLKQLCQGEAPALELHYVRSE